MQKVKYTNHDKERRYPEKLSRGDERTEFERDRSRVIHSGAFRRLQGKSQVFMAGEGDFFRTRLTHSLEVAQIGKGLAWRLKADAELVEAVSLIHDIGHPPFGHSGEQELMSLMRSYGGFEANAQNIRILTKLESKSNRYEGLNLTRATFDGQLKYKDLFEPGKEKFVYEEDLPLVIWASEVARSSATGAVLGENCKSFECEIMDWADEVAYAVHDLEDSIHAGYIGEATFRGEAEFRPRIALVIERVGEKFKNCRVNVTEVYDKLNARIVSENPFSLQWAALETLREQKANRKKLTSSLIGRYVKATKRIERDDIRKDAISQRYLYALQIPTEYRVEVALINGLIREFVIDSPQVRTLQEKGKHIIRCLFLKFMEKGNARYLLPDDWKGYLSANPSRKETARVGERLSCWNDR